jgi:hypothetical protein
MLDDFSVRTQDEHISNICFEFTVDSDLVVSFRFLKGWQLPRRELNLGVVNYLGPHTKPY